MWNFNTHPRAQDSISEAWTNIGEITRISTHPHTPRHLERGQTSEITETFGPIENQ